MDTLRVGDPLDKAIDVGAVVDPVQLKAITEMVDGTAGEVYRANVEVPKGCFYAPTLITGLSSSDRLMQEEIFGPVLVSTTFRTPSEAVQLANDTRYGLAATLWTENVNLALDVAPKLAAGVVWVNATNLFDAAAPFGGVRESGFGREGGWTGLDAYTHPAAKAKPPSSAEPFPAWKVLRDKGLDRTAKLYIGGEQARPDGGYSRSVWSRRGGLLGHASLANRKDVRNAVEAARGASSWSRTTGHARAQIIYYLAENLSARADEFAARIHDLTGKRGEAEVAASVDSLFTAAAWADKLDGRAAGVPLRGVALAMNEPVGVIGALCPDEAPLLGLTALLAPALAMGNRVVAVASQPFPLAATDLYQVLETSDVPAGVANILTGDHADLAKTLAGHLDVDAVWSFGPADAAMIERESAGNLKRTWTAGSWTEIGTALRQATETKTVWIPYGE
jgi:aldehyde dehydrogenase (NAD+)